MSDYYRFQILVWVLFWAVIMIILLIAGVVLDDSDLLIGAMIVMWMLGSHAIMVFGDEDEKPKPKRTENDQYFEAMRDD